MNKNTKNAIKRRIKNFIFGVRAKGEKIGSFSNIAKTVYPKEQPDFFEWAKEYKVGCGHKNKPIHF